jgi:hypothetical protein
MENNLQAIEDRNNTPRGRVLLALWRRTDGRETYAVQIQAERPQEPKGERE